MGTQFWVRWGPNGDLRQQKWGPKKRIFENWSKRACFLKYRGDIQEYCSTKFNFTDKLAWYSFKLVLSSEVFKWSTFNRQWLLWLLARSSAWNRENGDLLGTQKLKKVPMGTRVPKCGPTWEQCRPSGYFWSCSNWYDIGTPDQVQNMFWGSRNILEHTNKNMM